MDDDRVEAKLDKISDHLSNIDVTLATQGEVLKEHIRRSLANEKAVDTLKDEIKPVLSHVSVVNTLGKLAMVLFGSQFTYDLVHRIIMFLGHL